MDLTAEQFEDLVGAYALDACEPEEAEALDRYVAAHPEAATAVERLRDVAAGLGAAGASRPPVALRGRLVQLASERVGPMRAEDALRAETERFDRFLNTLDDADLAAPTYNGLTVQQLVQHVEVIDRAFVEAASDPASTFIGSEQVETITAGDLQRRVDEPFAETVTRFRRTRARLMALHDDVPVDQRIAGYRRDDTLVIRAFETWTHHDDIERALDRQVTEPDAAAMRTMAELAMKSLPLALAVRGVAHPGRSVRFVLTGPGGGEWTIPCSPDEEAAKTPDAVVRTSVADWCRRFADRVGPDELALEVEGDDGLVRDLVAAAPAFAGL
jgi:uncharacterized protein (TIGR03083 family)